MTRLLTFAFVVLAGLIILSAGQSSAQVKYVDEAGNTHYVQSKSMVPEQYRAKTNAVGPLPAVRVEGAQGGAPYTGLSGGYKSGPSRLDREDAQNAQRMQNAAEQNLTQKLQDKAKKDAYDRCVSRTISVANAPSCF